MFRKNRRVIQSGTAATRVVTRERPATLWSVVIFCTVASAPVVYLLSLFWEMNYERAFLQPVSVPTSTAPIESVTPAHVTSPVEPRLELPPRQETPTPESESTQTSPTSKNEDTDCPFRDSPIYRKVYVYPNYGDIENGWHGDILSTAGQDLTTLPRWPFLDIDESSRQNAAAHYNIKSQIVQYTTELLVREIMINPKSCLRTYNPEEATLFYVPYLPSAEFHTGHDRKSNYSTSPYGQAITDIIDNNNYEGWEQLFGLTAKYWKRRQGADHILVFSEPMHGLYHPRSRRGNFHFIHSQKQLKPPIVISVELSTTFTEMYPKCAAKNILMPYPNTDGGWFNGALKNQAIQQSIQANLTTMTSTAALPVEKEQSDETSRPVAQFYSAGHHGTCKKLRQAMTQDYKKCSPSYKILTGQLSAGNHALGMHLSTFCPCPGGDSPSAKRHFDALIAGCIPIILSHDFVWPFTNEFDPKIDLDPSSFSLRMLAQDYDTPLLNHSTCQPLDQERPGLQVNLEDISAKEIAKLRKGVEEARRLYTWYSFDKDLPENPLREGVLPDGGAAHQLVKMLAERAAGAMWPACEEELKQPRGPDPRQFKC